MAGAMWQRFLRAFAITAAAAIALSLAVILFVDPLGVSPITWSHRNRAMR
jgi:multidrug efflux pump subunit AcrB